VPALCTATAGRCRVPNVTVCVRPAAHVPSVAVLDFWSNYAARFADGAGQLAYQPDVIAVMDEHARDEAVADGLDPARLVVTGQPAFDDLAGCRARFDEGRRKAVREELGVRADELMVVFASQPFSLLYDPSHALYPGYDEQIVLRMLTEALDTISEKTGRGIVLIVRPHPREQPELLNRIKGRAIRSMVTSEGDSREVVMAADLVTGMNTVLLVESCYLGCVAVSLQPGLRLADALPTNRLGLTRAVYDEEGVRPALEELLLNETTRANARARLSDLKLDGGAARRVVELVYSMIGDLRRGRADG